MPGLCLISPRRITRPEPLSSITAMPWFGNRGQASISMVATCSPELSVFEPNRKRLHSVYYCSFAFHELPSSFLRARHERFLMLVQTNTIVILPSESRKGLVTRGLSTVSPRQCYPGFLHPAHLLTPSICLMLDDRAWSWRSTPGYHHLDNVALSGLRLVTVSFAASHTRAGE